jgi:hypothetical protein
LGRHENVIRIMNQRRACGAREFATALTQAGAPVPQNLM